MHIATHHTHLCAGLKCICLIQNPSCIIIFTYNNLYSKYCPFRALERSITWQNNCHAQLYKLCTVHLVPFTEITIWMASFRVMQCKTIQNIFCSIISKLRDWVDSNVTSWDRKPSRRSKCSKEDNKFRFSHSGFEVTYCSVTMSCPTLQLHGL